MVWRDVFWCFLLMVSGFQGTNRQCLVFCLFGLWESQRPMFVSFAWFCSEPVESLVCDLCAPLNFILLHMFQSTYIQRILQR